MLPGVLLGHCHCTMLSLQTEGHQNLVAPTTLLTQSPEHACMLMQPFWMPMMRLLLPQADLAGQVKDKLHE